MILFVINKKTKPTTLIDELKKADSVEEVGLVLRGIRNKTVFINLINDLLNELSDITKENKKLMRIIKKEEELEII